MRLSCNGCGEAFEAARKDARYCSPRCRTRAHRERHEGPRRPRARRPLPDAFRDGVYDLRKVTERLGRLADDDRFERNAPRLDHHRGTLDRYIDMLTELRDRIPEPSPPGRR